MDIAAIIKPLEAAIAALREQLEPPAGSAGMSSMCSFATDLTARSFCPRPS
jgi:hypothetical protein